MDWPIISSRTPEGEPNRCPLCGKDVILEPSQPLGDAPCPHCGHLLWFFRAAGETRIIAEPALGSRRRELLHAAARQLGVPEEKLSEVILLSDIARMLVELGIDSLDIVELIMELEEEFPELASDY
ncbi:MAG TPA: phosphopantetheine-binding protein [Pirellulales bacterium]|jgi:hypothetical protein